MSPPPGVAAKSQVLILSPVTHLLQPPRYFHTPLSARWQSACSPSEALEGALSIQEESVLASSLSSAPALLSDLLVSLLLFLSWSLKLRSGQGVGPEPTCSEHQCVPGLSLPLPHVILSDLVGTAPGFSPGCR